MKVDAIILAGGKLKNSNQKKAFIKLGEQTLLERSIGTLRECPSISALIVGSAPAGYKTKLAVDVILEDKGDLVENIAGALNKATSEKVLLVASDIPLLATKHVSEFINLCSKIEAGLYYPLIPKNAMGKFGSMKRTYFKLDRTEFTGGNIILIKKSTFLSNLELARKLYTDRKSPLKIGSLLGPYFLLKLSLGRLSVEEAEKKATKILGAPAKGIIVRHPEIGSDIDKEEDLHFIERMLGGNK